MVEVVGGSVERVVEASVVEVVGNVAVDAVVVVIAVVVASEVEAYVEKKGKVRLKHFPPCPNLSCL